MTVLSNTYEEKRKKAYDNLKAKGFYDKKRVLVGMATCEIAAGSKDILDVFEYALKKNKIDVCVSQKGCTGRCSVEPTLEIIDKDNVWFYVNVTKEKAQEIIESHLKNNKPIDKYTDNKLDKIQQRIVLRNCGIVDPNCLDDYLVHQGYSALTKVLDKMKPEDVVQEVKEAGLRGRGGAGFPTGIKWELTAKENADEKYVICNADEGDPGAFMDRSIIEGNPYGLLESMAIGAYAIGSEQGYIYIRAEYPLAIKRLEQAIINARKRNLLGNNILGSDFSFDIEIRLGAGAFVCGEETALIHSVEGLRGMPSPRPPYPSVKGAFGKPTLINNVETWASIPMIILKGADWFNAIGTEDSKGTKVFALAGNVEKPGLIEVPMGVTLREIIFDIGGGIPGGKAFKGVQTGGPSGGCLTEKYLDTKIDYASLAKAGSIMGSGGMIVMDENTCMVNIAKFFLEFTQDESCGKCTPCREGTKRMFEILTNITEGKGKLEDLEKLENLAKIIVKTSLCGLGQSAPNPALSTLINFREEYEEHIKNKRCKCGICTNLAIYEIKDNCIGCMACKRVCPVDAIKGEPKSRHEINQDRCIKCGQCIAVCKFEAIVKK